MTECGKGTSWVDRLIGSTTVEALLGKVHQHRRAVGLGASGSCANLLAGALAVKHGGLVVLVVAHLDEADDACDDMALFTTHGHELTVQRFGALEVLPGESNISLELLAERLGVVETLGGEEPARGKTGVLVAPIQALMQPVPRPTALGRFQLTVKRGRQIDPAMLIDWLDRAGYNRADVIEQPGDFATRGGIIDIYLPSAIVDGRRASDGPLPVRLDFFGDEIDTIATINTDTMGSAAGLDSVQIIGATPQKLLSDEDTTSLLELLPADSLAVLAETMELSEQSRGYFERLTDARGVISPHAVMKKLTSMAHIEINSFTGGAHAAQETMMLPVRPLPAFDTDAATAVRELAALGSAAETVVLCSLEAESDRLGELLTEHASGPGDSDRIRREVGYLHRGFIWGEAAASAPPLPAGEGPGVRAGPHSPPQSAPHPDPLPEGEGVRAGGERTVTAHGLDITMSPSALVLVPHHELFHRYHTRRRLRRVSGGAGTEKAADAFIDLDAGDCVVHVDHGIALFRGLKTMRRKGRSEEYLTLEFAQGALLHVPATQIELVQKYIGGFQGRPPLSTLGGRRWGKQKEAAAEAARELAREMLQVQAARAAMPGIRFPGDTPWQHEFEAEFPYEETEDQLAAIAEIKKDMADGQPMDRLICGDVGFGKTEVAIRAAFKAVESGRQVAVLVPTTVLAEQHERTFRERMADYPFRIESVSRFKTAREAKTVLDDLATGRVDVIIGTHRLLSADVKFNDLGMVIVDEEQRFGVEHKQKLLQFRLTADVLTLTATPIPRTLHMAMLGLRDISSLSTPPLDRRAIVTEVIPYDERRIRDALVRELNRDGQVFFVHNRVHNIQEVANRVQALVPEARIVVGHGQMSAGDLERVMLRFMRRKADILVCTTIIESGIDIPTANTMLINDADQFGLADLHQLRGRVGRYKHRAYCYLLLPGDRPVTDTARRRLKAIEQYAMLGAGFKIAMRDLEIRGAGNLLGREQSGHIAAVGYQMYCTLLEQEARRLQNDQRPEPGRTHLELPVPGRIEAGYIRSERYRMEAYRQLSRAGDFQSFDEVIAALKQAYGGPPQQTQMLLDLTEVRIAAGLLGVDSLKLDGPDLVFKTPRPRRLENLLAQAPGRVSLIDNHTVYWRPPSNYLDPPRTLLAVLRKLLVRPLREQESNAAHATVASGAAQAG